MSTLAPDAAGAAQFIPSSISTKTPIKAAVTDNGDGTVTFTFLGRLKEIENFNVTLEDAVAIRGEIPASATLLTPPVTKIVHP